MNSLKLYLEITRLVFGNSVQTQQTIELESLLASFLDSLSCRICRKLVQNPQTIIKCQHIVCKICINDVEQSQPAFSCCFDAKHHEPNNQISILLKLYKSLSDYLDEHKNSTGEVLAPPAEEMCLDTSSIFGSTNSTTNSLLAEVIEEDNSYMEELPIYTIKKEIEDTELIQPANIKLEEIDKFMSFSPPSPQSAIPIIKHEQTVKQPPPFKQFHRTTTLPTIKTEVQPILKYQQHQQSLLTNMQRTATPSQNATKMLTTVPKSSPHSLLHPKILVSTASQPLFKNYSQKPMPTPTPLTKTVVTQSHLMKTPSPKPLFNLSKNYSPINNKNPVLSSSSTSVNNTKSTANYNSNVLHLQKCKNPNLAGGLPQQQQQPTTTNQKISKINIISIERTNIQPNFPAPTTIQSTATIAPTLPTTTYNSHQIQAPIKTVSNGSTMYQVMYNGSGNKITIKRKIDSDESKNYGTNNQMNRDTSSPFSSSPSGSGMGNNFKKPINQAKLMKPMLKRRGCRCGCATATPGKLTCCGQRCPCYVDSKSCIDCKCRGCRNPHRADGLKVRPLIPELENLEINMMEKPGNFQYTNNHRLNLQINAFNSSNNVGNSSSSSSSSGISNTNSNQSILCNTTTTAASFQAFTCGGGTTTTATMTASDQQPQFQQFNQQLPRIIQQQQQHPQPTQFTTSQTSQLLYEQPHQHQQMKSILHQPMTTSIPVTDDSMLFNTSNIQVLGVYTTHNSQLSDTQTISDVVLLDDPMSSSNQYLQLYPSNHQINQIIYDEKPQQHFIMDGSSDDNDVDIE